MVFAQDIPQEAETTGNVCPASTLFYAYIHLYTHIYSMVGVHIETQIERKRERNLT